MDYGTKKESLAQAPILNEIEETQTARGDQDNAGFICDDGYQDESDDEIAKEDPLPPVGAKRGLPKFRAALSKPQTG